MNKTSLIYGLSFGIIKPTIVEFLSISDVLKGLLAIVIFIILVIFMYYKTDPNLKIALKKFIAFIIAFFATSSLLTFIYNPGSEFINVLTYEKNRLFLILIIGLILTLLRLSKKHFIKLSSIVLIFFVGMFLFATFNKEMVQKLMDSQKKEQLKTNSYD